MRLYLFNNFYNRTIGHGIQGLHAFCEIFERFGLDSPQARVAMEWNRDHKTVIILNGGEMGDLEEIHARLESIALDWDRQAHGPLPLAKFHESQRALAGALTSVAVVVPAQCYFDTRERRAAKRELFARMEEAGFDDPFEASADARTFSATERLALVCMAFALAN